MGTRKQRRQPSAIQEQAAKARSATRYFGSVLIFLFAIAVFWPSRSAGFVWDDQPYNLAGNPALMRGDVAAFWEHPYRDFHIPVSYSVWTALATWAVIGSERWRLLVRPRGDAVHAWTLRRALAGCERGEAAWLSSAVRV